ncbi:proline--tRNA ligase [Patescibacteria group bacterium]|nr:proline--tRNA ligase [Patescibacteria group bacterium]
MKYSKLLGKTRYDVPCDADSKNAALLTQAGFVERLAAGIYNYLPLGMRVLKKISQIIREEMDAVGGQEILMPTLHPMEIWEKTGRHLTMTDILFKTAGAGGKDFILGPSHEETVTPLVKNHVLSYKDLPMSVYQLQAKFRNEPRAKSGVLRGREFGMKDMYSFHTSEEDLNEYYDRVMEAYLKVYERCGLKAYVIEASGGAFTDQISHEFSVLTEAGEDTILISDDSSVAQNMEIAIGEPNGEMIEDEKEKDLELVDIERDASIKANAVAHGVPEWKILKTVVYEVEDVGLVGVVIRGDLNVNEHKLENYLQKRVRSADSEKLKEIGLAPGYISPVGMSDKIDISFIADKSVEAVTNFVTGANEYGKDYINVNVGRDFVVKEFVDLVEVEGGFKKDGKELKAYKAIEAGNIFKLGTKYSDAFGFKFTDSDGKQKPVIMGCYGIGTTRLVGTIVEASNDENGMIWPKSVAPYAVHIVSVGSDEAVMEAASKLYEDLQKAGVEVLFDDRDESPGVKFKDADLLGMPLRLVVSKKTLEQDSVEWKLRAGGDVEMMKNADVLARVKEFIDA